MKEKRQEQISPKNLVNEYGGLVSSLCYRMIPDPYIAE